MNNLKIPFQNYEKVSKNYSQAGQDLFVLSCLNGKTNGVYLDLGCQDPVEINNTFLLEKDFNWSGVSFDIDQNMINRHNATRKNKAFCQDCRKLDFNFVIENLGTNQVDYLSLDLEPASVTMECLKSIPFDSIEFKVITFEHDLYRFGDFYKIESRKLFEKNGYKMICGDVTCNAPFEDWYYNPKYVSYEYIKKFESDFSDWSRIIFS